MSRREGRDSHGKRLHSRSEREPSPKKPRRDGKPATERPYSSSRHSDNVDKTDQEQKQRRRLQDAMPLEVPLPPKTKVQSDNVKIDLDRKADDLNDTKHSSDPMEVPQSYFQHDERGSAGQGGRSLGYRATDHSKWSDPKELRSDRFKGKAEAHDLRRKDERKSHADDKQVWRHDRFYELETEAPPARKRPAFSEKKMPAEPESAAAAKESEPESVRLPHEQHVLDSARREERGHHSHLLDKSERPFTRVDERNGRKGDVSLHRAQMQQRSYQSRERFHVGFTRGRDRTDGRYSERNTYHPGVGQVEKWKHDLFEDANRSPTPKKEEEEIAKVEALLLL